MQKILFASKHVELSGKYGLTYIQTKYPETEQIKTNVFKFLDMKFKLVNIGISVRLRKKKHRMIRYSNKGPYPGWEQFLELK